jgi:hypothetical protein
MTRVVPTAVVLFTLVLSTGGAAAAAQTPQPFPRAGTPQPQRQTPAAPQAPAPQQQPPRPSDASAAGQGAKPAVSAAAQSVKAEPTADALGVAIYPGAQFLASYDAGAGQRYYLFGATASFAELVGYYRTQTGERGDLVFKEPPTHMFTGGTLARFRDETMAFPPSVTVKDWTSGGSPGYPNPKICAQPARFPTVIMIVPAPPGSPAPR